MFTLIDVMFSKTLNLSKNILCKFFRPEIHR